MDWLDLQTIEGRWVLNFLQLKGEHPFQRTGIYRLPDGEEFPNSLRKWLCCYLGSCCMAVPFGGGRDSAATAQFAWSSAEVVLADAACRRCHFRHLLHNGGPAPPISILVFVDEKIVRAGLGGIPADDMGLGKTVQVIAPRPPPLRR